MVKSQGKRETPAVAPAGPSPSLTGGTEKSSNESPAAMQVSVLLKEGKVLFVEASSDFVDVLTRVLQRPLGEVVGCVGTDEDKGALSHLQDAVRRLRDPLFVNGGQQKAKEIMKPMDVGGMLVGSAPVNVAIEVTPNCPTFFSGGVQGMPTISSTADGSGGFHIKNSGSKCWQSTAFTPSEECDEFSITWRHQQGANYMIGVAPANDGQLQTMLNVAGFSNCHNWGIHAHIASNTLSNVFYNGTSIACNNLMGGNPLPQLVVGETYSMRLQMHSGAQPVMEFCDTASKQWKPIRIPNFPIPMGKYIPFLHLNSNTTLNVTEMKFADSCPNAAVPKPIFHPVARFLIANDLEICESSSLKALEIMQKYDVNDAEALRVHTTSFGAPELQRLIGRALCGETDVLDYALKGCLGGPSSPASSVASPSTLMSAEMVEMDKF